ncbi:hypothetical protein [uncultured Duncaniella sp.]|uniref:condensin complex protein MksE n=1 Tax=uncultured Duncaniella sp. TaxID=2768039 RepID=UPI0025FB1B3D|nr:hypothetical protein [uncultured Duncaniella sp.]
MKYVQQVFERLSRGGFIPADSVDESIRRIYIDLEDNREDYAAYFSKIGFILEEGKQYFHFSRRESKTALTDKLKKMGHWIDVLDFLKAWEPAFGPGFSFMTADLIVKIDADIELRDKARFLYDNKTRHDEIAIRLVEELTKQGFIELLDDVTQRYSVTSAYRYLEDLVQLIAFEDEDEISK